MYNATSFFKFVLYADDTTLKCKIDVKNISTQAQDINLEIKKVSDWLAVNLLSLNVSKTKYMIFHNKNTKLSQSTKLIQINGTSIERVNTFDFLGLTISENLSWKPHTDKIANKLVKYLGILNRLKRYLPLHVMKMLYFSLVQSNLNYAILAWGYESNRLEKLQKRFIRIISCSSYNAHTEPLFKKLELLKLEDLFNVNVMKFYYKYCHESLPSYFYSFNLHTQADIHDYGTRSQGNLSRVANRTKLAQSLLRNQIPVKINTSPSYVTEKINTHSLNGFSDYLKKYYIKLYSNECTVVHCYICQRK